jgi:hypothetical protein
MKPITTAAEADQALDDLTALIGKLSELLQQETVLVHAGRLRSASGLEATKAELAGQLSTSGERLKANAKFLQRASPARCAALGHAQEALRFVLQKNMIVLATAHAVSEGIMRRLSSDLTRKASPQVYGASGRTTAPNPRNGRPLAVSRTL